MIRIPFSVVYILFGIFCIGLIFNTGLIQDLGFAGTILGRIAFVPFALGFFLLGVRQSYISSNRRFGVTQADFGGGIKPLLLLLGMGIALLALDFFIK
jgi:hypothetical protein